MGTRIEASLIRIQNSNGDAIGAGFLVADRQALTGTRARGARTAVHECNYRVRQQGGALEDTGQVPVL